MSTRTRRKSIFATLLVSLVAPAGAAAAIPFAPYVDMAGYPPPALAQWSKPAGLKRITLGFVTAREASACDPTWGGYADYPAAGSDPYRLADVRAFEKRGGTPVVSFGGQAGTELASVCSTDELAAAYGAVADAYGTQRLDFDIEGAATQDTAANARRADALAALQGQRPKLSVSLTLPVLPTGLPADALAVVKRMKAAGVKIDLVNVMAMDYGESAAPHPDDGGMGRYAVAAGRATIKQLEPLFGSKAARRVSVTPMIGVNDVSTEVFTLTDARKLRRWAGRVKLGGLSMWQLGRDAKCAQPSATTQLKCSGVAQGRWAFSRALG